MDKNKADIRPLFYELAIAFEKQFGVNIRRLDRMPQDQEITGVALEKMKAYVKRINQSVEEDYVDWCDFSPVP